MRKTGLQEARARGGCAAATENTGFGLNLTTGVGYSQNVIRNNTAGTVDDGVSAGGNVCNGSTTCP